MGNSDQTIARWWEFYAVRYGMGTVVGAVLFFFLCNTNPVLKPMLFGAETGKIDGPLLALLAGYGLAYCYIASAPILVFHVARFLLDIPPPKGANKSVGVKSSPQRSLLKRLSSRIRNNLFLFGPPLIVAAGFYFLSHSSGAIRLFYTAVTLLGAMIICPQYLALFFTLARSNDLLTFYKRLADKRNTSTSGIVESYKHMREHGNSFFIVFLEILLAIVLFCAGNAEFVATSIQSGAKESYVIPYVAIILIWIVPAAFVWLVGTVFERGFMDT